MRSLHSLTLLAASAITSGLLVTLSYSWTLPLTRPLLGIYQPSATEIQKSPLGLDVLFLDWNDHSAAQVIDRFLKHSQQRQRLPLITLEPFVKTVEGRGGADLAADVLSGLYDPALARIGSVLAAYPEPILLRFGHEMDKTGQYPWAVPDPSRYIDIYRYVYHRLRPKAGNLVWVWSPAGGSNSDRFWPGHQYVDVIGISIYSSRSWSKDASLESFSNQLGNKFWLQRRFRKPVLVAEAGVSGSALDQLIWIQNAVSSLARYPEVCGLVYFQAQQPSWMPLATGPDTWELKPMALQWLLRNPQLEPRQGLSCVEG